MLKAVLRKKMQISGAERKEDRLYLYSEAYRYRLEPKTENILRVTVTKRESFSEEEKPGVLFRKISPDWSYQEDDETIQLFLRDLQVRVNKEQGFFTYCDADGRILLQERKSESKSLEEFTTYRLADRGWQEKEIIETADGKKEILKAADKVEAEKLYHTRLYLEWQQGERLYGLGQQEEGLCNLRGQTVYVHQANRKIAVPLLVSSLGYGVLTDTYSPMIFSDTVYGSYLYTEADKEMDFYIINGKSMKGVIKGYRLLTGKASLLPKWAYGYIQSQERYETQEEILETARQYRKRELGLDALVLDWCSWEDGKWGQKSFDTGRFPNAEEMITKLHEQDIHFMVSIWPNMDENCADYLEFKEKGLLLPGSNVYNALEKAGRRLYFEQVDRAFFSKGADAFWCDSSEPYTPEWNHPERPEPATMFTEYCKVTENHIPAWQTNAFSLYHAMAVYEGQRSVQTLGKEKRVFNLTRSAYTGQQRYGTVFWSGDTGASWDTLKKQIAAGLAFSASGMPYWTADIGAFFVKKGEYWYWDGEYDDTTADLGYRELFVRWFQWGCFLPVFRGHGTDCRRELWNFGEEGEPFYEALVKMNKLRYNLMPYIYSAAGKVWREDDSLIHMLAYVFEKDEQAAEISDQFLFGDGILVCPVTEPMYYTGGSKAIFQKDKTRKLYLPKGQGWYDFWSGRYLEGGQWIIAEAPLDRLPLFIKEGTILPMADFTGKAGGYREIFLQIYAGKDAELLFYEDEGDGYGYEKGEYCLRKFLFDEEKQELLIKQEYGNKDAGYMAKVKNYTIIGKGKENLWKK